MFLGTIQLLFRIGSFYSNSFYRPYGTVIANDVFSSGFLLSEYGTFFLRDTPCAHSRHSTDFRQFQEYQNLTGLDVSVA